MSKILTLNKQMVESSAIHREWWANVCADRDHFHAVEEGLAATMNVNASALLPKDAWREVDDVTMRVLRNDEGQAYMADLMPLAKAINIGKLAHVTRVSSDAGSVTRSLSGQKAVPMDKVDYDYRGTPIPIFDSGYGREWREWSTLQSENFDALMDDQEASVAALRQDMAQYALTGDPRFVVEGYQSYGIRNNPLTKQIDLGASGANIDLTTATPTEIESFVNTVVGQTLDDNYIATGVNWYVSPEINRNLDQPYSGADGFKVGSLRQYLESNRRINKIVTTFELTGNSAFAFVPNSNYIRPLVGMAVNTIAIPRTMPRSNYQFLVSGAMGLEIRADYNGRTGVINMEATT